MKASAVVGWNNIAIVVCSGLGTAAYMSGGPSVGIVICAAVIFNCAFTSVLDVEMLEKLVKTQNPIVGGKNRKIGENG